MKVRDNIFRLTRILKRLKRGGVTFQELDNYIQSECSTHDFEYSFSNSTFIRDRKLIFTIFGVEIVFCRKSKKYYIDCDDLKQLPPEGSSAFLYLI